MTRLLLSMTAAGAVLAASWPLAHAAATRTGELEWISQKTIDARGGYKLKVGTLGNFVIKGVRPAAASATHSACLVHVPSVRTLITQGISQGTLDFSTGAVKVELKVTTCPKGFAGTVLKDGEPPSPDPTDSGSGGGGGDEEELCCKGGGKGCVADIDRLP